MFTLLKPYRPQILSLSRIAFGLTFLEHGTQKLFLFPGAPAGQLAPGLELFTGLLETIGGVLFILGLFTPITAFVLSGEMAVGYWWMHAPRGLFPTQNGGEAQVLYCFIFLYYAAAEAGPWSVDAILKRG